jgi:hypothetical protein
MPAIDSQLDIDRQQVLTNIGYADDYTPSARITSLVNDYIENYHDLLSPAYDHVVRDILGVNGNRVTIEGDITFESGVIARLLEPCEQVAVFALTIGSYLEDLVAYLAEEGLVLQATVLDAIGSGAAEELAVFVKETVRGKAAEVGRVVSRRFSPGYCDWNVSQQEAVFAALGGKTAGVRLSESSLMMPRKSVSGVIGIGRPGHGIEEYNPCRTCLKEDCPGRRK